MGNAGSRLSSQEPTTCSYPEPDKSSPCPCQLRHHKRECF